MRSNPFSVILWSILFGFGIYLTIRYLWPLLLVIGIVIAIGVIQLRRTAREQEREFERMEETIRENERPSYQDQLFQEQVNRRREEAGEIVDVEFTRKEEKAGEGHDSGSQ